MNDSPYSAQINSPLGKLQLKASVSSLTAVRFVPSDEEETSAASEDSLSPPLQKTKKQLDEYFKGERKAFDLPLEPHGTAFQQSVWKELKQIPYGSSITYKKLAQRLGDENKIRAVGRANGKNPLPIIIPCHRVIGANNHLVGYAGGIERKRWLLRHEGVLLL
jgi:methylated-DNA-[protein]-cysteine S-methyltransferase